MLSARLGIAVLVLLALSEPATARGRSLEWSPGEAETADCSLSPTNAQVRHLRIRPGATCSITFPSGRRGGDRTFDKIFVIERPSRGIAGVAGANSIAYRAWPGSAGHDRFAVELLVQDGAGPKAVRFVVEVDIRER